MPHLAASALFLLLPTMWGEAGSQRRRRSANISLASRAGSQQQPVNALSTDTSLAARAVERKTKQLYLLAGGRHQAMASVGF